MRSDVLNWYQKHAEKKLWGDPLLPAQVKIQLNSQVYEGIGKIGYGCPGHDGRGCFDWMIGWYGPVPLPVAGF